MLKFNKTSEAVRRQAQELVNQAAEARYIEDTVRLCKMALELDPRCVDALLLLASTSNVPDKRVEQLRVAVQVAKEELGGDKYLKQNKGHFWGLWETRSYMRGRAFLAEALQQAGKIDEAIAEYEELIVLNPNDNQGNRYLLMGLYLETDYLAGIHRLQSDYENDGAANFAWAAVLERLISGDEAGAEQLLADARETNRHFEFFILNKKKMPKILPDYYAMGEESEAIVCMLEIGNAWQQHPDAIRWLHERALSAAPADNAKVAKNDLCPCGSGKKYKKCCLGRDQAKSTAFDIDAIDDDYNRHSPFDDIEDLQFESLDEVKDHLTQFTEYYNSQPIDDFAGLSAVQMQQLLTRPFESPEIIEFPAILDTKPDAPVIKLFELLIQAIGEGGLKTTVTGNLPLKTVRDIVMAYLGEDKYADLIKISNIRSEDNFVPLKILRQLAQNAGLIRKYLGKFLLCKKYHKLLKDGGMSALYPFLMREFVQNFNWAYLDHYPEDSSAQINFAYSLFLLTQYGNEWREKSFYEDALIRAFPVMLDLVKPTTYDNPEQIIRKMYSHRFFQKFAEFFGLVEIDLDSGERYGRDFKVRNTPLLASVVKFKI